MTKLFISKFKYCFAIIFALMLQSCANVEQYHQQKPVLKRTKPPIAFNILPKLQNSSLFRESVPNNRGYQPLFEDHRPHNIGDIVTVVLKENISASNSSFSDLSRDGNTNLGLKINPGPWSAILGLNFPDDITGLDTMGTNNFHGNGSNSAQNHFTGLITATVEAVLPNGNLKIVGKKQVAINKGIEFIRFSGVINPNNINQDNFIISTKIADARIEYFSHGRMNNAQKIGWLQRLLLKISPI